MTSSIRTQTPLVRPSRGKSIDDLAEHLQRHIERNVHGRIRDLRVAYADGVILLQGHCSTQHTKQLALEAVLDALDDVPTVVNHLVVRSLESDTSRPN